MFTDGLVERRDRPFDSGVDEIVVLLDDLTEPPAPDQLVTSLLAALLNDGTHNEDDVVLLVARNDT